MSSQALDETVEFAQKVYFEQVHTVRHDIWDVHTNRARWWVITDPMNLYSQDQFPNMDLALTFNDAEAAVASTELTISLFTTGLIRYVRGVPDCCPSCGSQKLSPQRGIHSSVPDTTYERPVCQKCGGTGTPAVVRPSPPNADPPPSGGECVIMRTPLRMVSRPAGGGPRQVAASPVAATRHPRRGPGNAGH
jgi:hypothetical protein